MSEITNKKNESTALNNGILTRKFICFISIYSFVIIIYLICDAIAGTWENWFAFGLLKEPVSFLLGGFTILDGIDLFSGRVGLHSFIRQLHLLNSILVYFVLAPFLLLSGLRAYFIDRKNSKGIFKISTVKIYIGSILFFNIVFNSFYMLYDASIRQVELVHERSKDLERNRIQKNIQQLAVAGTQMYILKSENLNRIESNAFIPKFKDFPPYEWLDDNKYKIIPYNNEDTLFTITGVGNVIGDSAGFINVNGDTGKIQETIVIHTDASFYSGWFDN